MITPTLWPVVRQVSLCWLPTSVQEVMDLAAVAHLSAIKGQCSVPALLRWFPYFSRNPEDRSVSTMMNWQRSLIWMQLKTFKRTCAEPRTSRNQRYCSEPRYLLPGLVKHATHISTMLCPLVVEEYMGEISRDHRQRLQTVQLLWCS